MELPDGQARCSVYAHRPAACAAFPFAVEDGVVHVRDDTVCGPGSWRIGPEELQSRHALVTRAELGWSQHRVMVTHWNRHVDSHRPRIFSRTELFDYLVEADQWIGQLRSGCSDEEFAKLIAVAGGGPGAPAELDFLADIAEATTARTR